MKAKAMTQKNMNVILSQTLQDFVGSRIESGYYNNVSEYVRDLIRRDKERLEAIEAQNSADADLWQEIEKGLNSPVSKTLTMDNIRETLHAVIDRHAK